jgi:hypothetical protein
LLRRTRVTPGSRALVTGAAPALPPTRVALAPPTPPTPAQAALTPTSQRAGGPATSPRRRAAWLFTGAIAFSAGAGLITPAAPTAVAAEDSAAATVTLDTVTSSALEPDGVLVLSGTVSNVGNDALRSVQVLPRYSTDPLESAADVTRVTDDDSFRTGSRDERHFDAVASRLDPGEASAFHIEVPVDDLGLPRDGVYVIGVDVRATPSGRSRETVADVRTVMPYVAPDSALPQVPVAFVWSLTDRPSMLPDGTLTDDALAAALAPEGRLGNLVAVGTQAPVSWLIDPDLVGTAQAMADGYDVQQPYGSLAPGTGRDAASAWLTGLARAVSERRFVAALPVGDADLVATVRSATPAVQTAARKAVAPQESLETTLSRLPTDVARNVSVTTGVLAPVGGAIDENTVNAVTDAATRTLILDAANLDGTGGSPAGRLDANGQSYGVVSSDAVLSSTLALAEEAGGDVQIRQRLRSVTALRAISAAQASTNPVPLIAAAPHRWAPTPTGLRTLVDVWTQTPWVKPVGLEEAAASQATPPEVTLDYSESDQARELSLDYLRAVDRAHGDVSRVSTVLANPSDAAAPYEQALIRALSAAWRQDEPGGQAFIGAVTVQADRSLAAVRVGVPGALTLSGRSGRFPVTIENGLGDAVRVGLRFTSSNPDRITVPDVPAQVIEPGETAQVLVAAEAVANGRVQMSVYPVTGDSAAISTPQNFVIVATNFDTIGWVIVGGAVIVLFGAAAVRLVRRGLRRQVTAEPRPSAREHQGVR